MVRQYARVAAVVLLAVGVAGFSGLWGFDLLSGSFHAGVGALFAYAGFVQRDRTTVRQIVGGLGVLLLVVKAATVLAALVWSGRLGLGSVEVTCMVVGIGSVLAARYLRDSEAGGAAGRS